MIGSLNDCHSANAGGIRCRKATRCAPAIAALAFRAKFNFALGMPDVGTFADGQSDGHRKVGIGGERVGDVCDAATTTGIGWQQCRSSAAEVTLPLSERATIPRDIETGAPGKLFNR